MKAFEPYTLPLEASLLNPTVYIESLIDATSKLEVYKEKLKDSKLDVSWFLPTLQQKEALASAVLEGTQATLDGVLINQIVPNEKDKGLTEVRNYFSASAEGYAYLRNNSVSIELIKETHKRLMAGNVRGKNMLIGEFRTKQNYIGNTNANNSISYIPPVHEKVNGLMENLINYMNNPSDDLRPLVRTAIIHAQFETIHPFMDGNGRLGRILIPLYLYSQKQITLPSFFISEALERDKFKYYKFLNELRFEKRWGEWINFFLQAVIAQCEKYIGLVSSINNLYYKDLARAKELINNNKVVDLMNLLFKFPIITASTVTQHLDIPPATAIRYLNILAKSNIIYSDEKRRNKNFYYYDLLNLIRD